MFEVAELGHTISKQDYMNKVPQLRTDLLTIQQDLRDQQYSVIILISGVDGGGKGQVINLLNEWLDPRLMRTNAYHSPSDEEKERPVFWRYWRTLPAKGTIGLYVGSWYSQPMTQRIHKKIKKTELNAHLAHINQWEQQLSDDKTLIIKCWLHLEEGQQKKRLKHLAKNSKTAWQVSKRDKKHLKMYQTFANVYETVLTKTSNAQNPWLVVDGCDIRYSSLTVGQHILQRIQSHLAHHSTIATTPTPLPTSETPPNYQLNILDSLDLSLNLSKKSYNAQLSCYQGRLNKLARDAHEKKISSVLAFEGWDAGGKGGAIRRLTQAMDARNYQVISIAAPTEEERLYHYLWRFWRHMPRSGQVTIYDRSWYGRVLVERIEGFATEQAWQRAYSEIRHFEEALTDHGMLLLKFWLHIDPDEQLRRFKAREQISYKQYKITEEDYRNREKWDHYSHAVNDMVSRTSTQTSPWTLVEANDKRYARIKILQTYCARLEEMLDQ